MNVQQTIDLGSLRLEILQYKSTRVLNLFLPNNFDPIELKNKIPLVKQIMIEAGFDNLLVIGIPRSWNRVVSRFCSRNNLGYLEVNDYTCCVCFQYN